MDLINYLFGIFLQYVSALRPPKQRSSVPMRSSMDSEMEDESLNSKYSILNRRQSSFTYYRPLPSRETFQCRSLQDFSTTVARTKEEELRIQQRQTSFAQSGSSLAYNYCNISTSSESARESVNIPDIKNEWKEVDYFLLGQSMWTPDQ